MNHTIFFILSTAGFTWILVKSPLFTRWREFLSSRKDKNFVFWFLASTHSCIGCCGFWAGLINYYALIYIPVISYTFAGSICSLILVALVKMIDKK